MWHLRSSQEWLWQQQAHLSRIDFLHVEATQALNNVLDKAPLMRDVPAEHILDATHLYRDYKADEITELLEHMSPSVDGVCVVICSTRCVRTAVRDGMVGILLHAVDRPCAVIGSFRMLCSESMIRLTLLERTVV